MYSFYMNCKHKRKRALTAQLPDFWLAPRQVLAPALVLMADLREQLVYLILWSCGQVPPCSGAPAHTHTTHASTDLCLRQSTAQQNMWDVFSAYCLLIGTEGRSVDLLTVKSMPIVSYCRWTLSARSSKSLTIEGFSRDMVGLRPECTMAGHVRAMQSQSCRLARHTPPWFPNRQYKAPCNGRGKKVIPAVYNCSLYVYVCIIHCNALAICFI